MFAFYKHKRFYWLCQSRNFWHRYCLCCVVVTSSGGATFKLYIRLRVILLPGLLGKNRKKTFIVISKMAPPPGFEYESMKRKWEQRREWNFLYLCRWGRTGRCSIFLQTLLSVVLVTKVTAACHQQEREGAGTRQQTSAWIHLNIYISERKWCFSTDIF